MVGMIALIEVFLLPVFVFRLWVCVRFVSLLAHAYFVIGRCVVE
jgi:hypothetical protein